MGRFRAFETEPKSSLIPMTRPNPMRSEAEQALRKRVADHIEADDLALPLLSTSAMRVLELSQGGDSEVDELAEAVRTDPALTAHVLSVANSAAYCPAEPILSVGQAISRLGMGKLKSIAVAVVCRQELFRAEGNRAELEELWRHCSLVAAWSGEIARQGRRNVETAFLAGLLHDVGQPIVLSALDAIEELGSAGPGRELRATLLDEYHASVGERLMRSWRFPEDLVAAVTWHHEPALAGHAEELAHTVHLADLLGHWSMESIPAQRLVREERLSLDASVAALCLYVDELDDLLSKEPTVQFCAEAFA